MKASDIMVSTVITVGQDAREALINAAMGSFAAKANVFLVKAASHSGGRERMA